MSSIALVALFTTCIETIEYVEQYNNCARDVKLALTKLSLMKRRLIQWGAAVSIKSPGAETKTLRDRWPSESGVIVESLMEIREILENTTHMCRRYQGKGKDKEENPAKWLQWRIDDCVSDGRNLWEIALPSRKRTLRSVHLKALWVVQDRRRFEALIADFDFLLSNLEKIGERLHKERASGIVDRTLSSEYASLLHFSHRTKMYLVEDKVNNLMDSPFTKSIELDIVEENNNQCIDFSPKTKQNTFEDFTMNSPETQLILHRADSESSDVIRKTSSNSNDSDGQKLSRPNQQQLKHHYANNKSRGDSDIRAGDYYQGGVEPSSAKKHNYINNESNDNSTFWMGNTDGETATKLAEKKYQARERRESAKEALMAQKGRGS